MIADDGVTNVLTYAPVGQFFQEVLGWPRPPLGGVDLQDFLASL